MTRPRKHIAEVRAFAWRPQVGAVYAQPGVPMVWVLCVDMDGTFATFADCAQPSVVMAWPLETCRGLSECVPGEQVDKARGAVVEHLWRHRRLRRVV